ncbi:hypothetical protein JOE21_002590 [Desmospora profundinema]|uniref:Uncharacterized protein n=1 Tax=Desmospora profundinema TaxID=1571184 RepID=A0ABU1IPB2_9BACL|nr:hypothetical protein [Desmospora profundinema]
MFHVVLLPVVYSIKIKELKRLVLFVYIVEYLRILQIMKCK